jgi:putative endonuclease
MANGPNGTIYLGVTSDLGARAYQHRNGLIEGFTKKHNCTLLVWFEQHDDLQEARLREVQLKRWKRTWKIALSNRVIRSGRICSKPYFEPPCAPAFAGALV